MEEPLIGHVSDTAFMVAAFRAAETERPDSLFRDPLAGSLAGERGKEIVAKLPKWFLGAWTVALRTVIIDDFIGTALQNGVDTVLNLGAGLDTRPYRMALSPSLQWIEVDYPHVIAWKNSRLADERPTCRLERIGLDFADLPARQRLFSDLGSRSAKILVLTEGVIPYLSNEEVAALASELRKIEQVRFLIVDYYSREALRYRHRKIRINRLMKNAPFRFEPKDWFQFFDSLGWRPREVRYIAEEARRLNRRVPWPWLQRMLIGIGMFFMGARRKEVVRKFAAYVLLEPK
jgi:methyltransferase (TIGR00027 family)